MRPYPLKVFLAIAVITFVLCPCISFSDAIDDFFREYRKLTSPKPFQEDIDKLHNINNQLSTISYEDYTSKETAAFMKVFNLLDMAEMVFYYEQEILVGIAYHEVRNPPLTYKRSKERWTIIKSRLVTYVGNLENLYGNLSNPTTLHLVNRIFFLVRQSIEKMDKFYEQFYELLPTKAIYERLPSGEIIKHE